MNILKILAIFVIGGACHLSAQALEVNPIDFGAIPNDNLDDSAAIQAAINETLLNGGGTVTFPTGKLNLNARLTVVPANYLGGEIKFTGSRGSVVEVSVGGNEIGIYAGNMNVMTIEDVVFVGKNVTSSDPKFYDARWVVFSNFVNQTNLIRSQFFGLATPSNGSVVYIGNTDGRITDCQFDGSLGQYPGGAVVLSENSRGLTVSRSTFLDYANSIEGYRSKTTAFTGAWVKVLGGMPLNGNGFRRAVIEDSRFDEGAATAVWIEGAQWLSYAGNSTNLNGTNVGRGLFLKDVAHAEVKQSWFGYTPNSRPALDVLNVGAIEITSLRFGGGVYFMRKENLTSLSIKYCTPCSRSVPSY